MGIPRDRIIPAYADRPIELGNFRVTPIPSAHEVLHPDQNGDYHELGYLIDSDTTRIFHAGDMCMYDGLIARGINPERIWLEDKATSTWENLQFSLDLIEEKTGLRPETIGIISSEYHLFRAGLFADACQVESVGIPAKTTLKSQKLNHFLREVAGVWHYILLGGQYEN